MTKSTPAKDSAVGPLERQVLRGAEETMPVKTTQLKEQTMTMMTRQTNAIRVLGCLALAVASTTMVLAQPGSRSATQMSAQEVAALEPRDSRASHADVAKNRKLACGVDQSQLSNTVCMAAFAQTDLAQSFIPALPFSCGATIALSSGIGNPGAVTIELWDGLPNAGGNLLATGTDPGAVPGGFATVNWPSVAVTTGTTYYLVFTADAAGQNMCIGGDTNNPYPFGNVFANPGYNPFPTFDYTFETFGDAVPVELMGFEVE